MKTEAAPVPRRKQGYDNLGPIGGALAVVLIIQRMGSVNFTTGLFKVCRQLLVRQGFGPANEHTAIHVNIPPFTDAMLYRFDLSWHPVIHKSTHHAANPDKITVIVGKTLPRADRREVRRLQT